MWLTLIVLSILSTLIILIPNLYPAFSNLLIYSEKNSIILRFIRPILKWLLGVAIFLRAKELIGTWLISKIFAGLARKIYFFGLFQRMAEFCCTVIAMRVGVGNDDIATKEWLLDEVCHLSSLNCYRMSNHIKSRTEYEFGGF